MGFHFVRKPYPGEALYSIAARMRAAIGFGSALDFLRSFYGACKFSLGLGLTNFLEANGRDATKHQPLHFITSFITPPGLRLAIWDAVKTRDTKRVGYSLGSAGPRRLVGEFLRYCPACAAAQRLEFGEAYWTRGAQIVGVTCCPIHAVKFADTTVSRRLPRELHELETVLRREGLCDQVREENPAHWLLAQEVHRLLTFEPRWDKGGLARGWRTLLASHGVRAYQRGLVKRIQADLAKVFGEEYLLANGCGSSIAPEMSWIAGFLRKPADEIDPLRHLLILAWLGETLDALVSRSENEPFGDTRFDVYTLTCKNFICSDFGKPSIKQTGMVRDPRTHKEVGHYICGTCNAIFGRDFSAGPEREDTIIDRGDLWRSKLTTSWADSSQSLRAIARRLRVDPMTVKREAVKLHLSFPRLTLRPTRQAPAKAQPYFISAEERIKRRAAWATTLRKAKTTKAARGAAPATYAWLYRHDGDWLRASLPPRRFASSGRMINWPAREKELLSRVPDAYLRIIGARPFRRCSITTMAHEMGGARQIEHLDKMPSLKSSLAEIIEDTGRFAVRRILATVKELKDGQKTLSGLRKAAGIPTRIAQIPAVKNLMIEELKKVQS